MALCTINVVGIYLCMPYDVALCTINVVGIYLCIPYDVALMYNQCSWDISVHTI